MAVLWTFGLLLDVKDDEDLVRFEKIVLWTILWLHDDGITSVYRMMTALCMKIVQLFTSINLFQQLHSLRLKSSF